MTDRELMHEVLEALESLHRTGDTQVFDMCAAPVLIPALRERLAQPEQEPVAMRYDFDGYGYKYIDSGSGSNWQTRIKDAEPLYETPPRRKWVPLTLAEFNEIHDRSETMHEAMVDVVKKLREKNA